jgi:hypothetical protein
MPSIHASAHALAATAKKPDHPLNPAQQARAADPSAKGAAFGALVSQFAKAKHAPPPTDPPADPPVVTPPADTTNGADTTTTDTNTATGGGLDVTV